MRRVLKVAAPVLDQIVSHARREQPLECCGLLAGRQGLITEAFPAANAAASAREYLIDPGELIATLRMLRERGLQHLGIYHSHPQSDNVPSHRDIELASYPSCAYLIISLNPPPALPVRAFAIANGRVSEMAIEIIPPPS